MQFHPKNKEIVNIFKIIMHSQNTVWTDTISSDLACNMVFKDESGIDSSTTFYSETKSLFKKLISSIPCLEQEW